jgi:hypothetical protein
MIRLTALRPLSRAAARLLEGVLDAADVANPYRVTALVGHDQVQESGRVLDAAHRPQHEFARPLVDAAAGQFQVLPGERLTHVLNR